MLATSHCTDHYIERTLYVNQWTDDHSIRIPWLNFLTSQSIPEETDVSESSRHCRSDSDSSSSSSSSIEDCYIVLEVQKPHSIIEPTSIVDEDLNFAQIIEDDHHVNYDQLVQLMTIEVPLEDRVIEHQLKETAEIDVSLKAVQRTYDILFHVPEKLDKSISVSDDDFLDMTELQTNTETMDHDSISSIFDLACSITSGDSIENDTLIENNFSAPSSKQKANRVQAQRENPITTTLKHPLAFNGTCVKRYHRVEEHKINHMQTNAESPASHNLSRASTFLRRVKDRARHVKTKYNLSSNEMQSTEPSLLQIRYLDGRPSLMDVHACQSQMLSDSVSSQMSLSTKSSYGKRIMNHIQTVFRSTTNEESLSKRQKTVLGFFMKKS